MISPAENIIPDLDATPKILSPPTPARAGPGKGKCWKNMMELLDTDTDSASDTDDDSVGMMTNRWKKQLKKYYTSHIKCAKKKLDWMQKKKKY
jgi:hypothetical protein